MRAYDGDDVVAATRVRAGTRVRIMKTDIVRLKHTSVGSIIVGGEIRKIPHDLSGRIPVGRRQHVLDCCALRPWPLHPRKHNGVCFLEAQLFVAPVLGRNKQRDLGAAHEASSFA